MVTGGEYRPLLGNMNGPRDKYKSDRAEQSGDDALLFM